MKSAKVYDWNGTLISMDGVWDWLKKEEPELFHQARVIGAEDKEVYRAIRPRLLDVLEYATDQGLYSTELIPGARERLEADRCQGHSVVVFTGAPTRIMHSQLAELGIDHLVDDTVNVDTLRKVFGLGNVMKEDPILFEALLSHLQQNPKDLVAYTDNTLARLQSAIAANRRRTSAGYNDGFSRFYLFEPKPKHGDGEGYTSISSILDAE